MPKKKAQDALLPLSQKKLDELDRLKAVFDAIPGYVSWVSSELKYLGANRMLCDSLKIGHDEIAGREVGFSGSNEVFAQFIRKLFQASEGKATREMKLAFTSGERSFLLVGNKYGDGDEAVILGFDVSDVKRKEDIILAQEERMISVARIVAVGEMAGGIAHEIATPLTIVMGYASLLEEMTRSGSLDRESVLMIAEKIRTTGDRIGRIVKGLKALLHGGKGEEIKEVGLKSLFEGIDDLARPRFRRYGVSLLIDPLPEGLRIECQETQIAQVVINLLNNSIDALSGTQEDPCVRITVHDHGDDVEIRVTDSGGGIPAEIRERIFEPFFTTKGQGKGTGLGLNLSRGFVEEHRGEIFVDETCPNTCFVIRLPKRQPRDQVPVSPVLVVDDEEAILRFASSTLRKAGYSVLEADSGNKAFRLLRERYVRLGRVNVSAVITDCAMADGDGFQLHSDILSSPFRDVPVVYMSGAYRAAEVEKIQKRGPVVMMQKPLTAEEFLARVREATSREQLAAAPG